MKKALISVVLALCLLFAFALPVSADDIEDYTVFVLDTSNTHGFTSNGKLIYTADTAVEYVKAAAKEFANAILGLRGNHHIAVVAYDKSGRVVCDFSTDKNEVIPKIDALFANGSYDNLYSGLCVADDLLLNYRDSSVEQNVVIFTTGHTNEGNYITSGGRYTKYDYDWSRTSDKKYIYAFSNGAYKKAKEVGQYADIYSVGLFQQWDNMPSRGWECVNFFKRFAADLATDSENYFPVYNTNDIKTGFAYVCSKIANNCFKDVTYEQYYFFPVIWATENYVTSGTTQTTFEPNRFCTRGQIVTFLWNAVGQPKVETENPFVDVKEDDFFYDAVMWAVAKGITAGTDETHFSPYASCARAHAVTFLWRFGGEEEVAMTCPFKDTANDAYYYKAVMWAIANQITFGTDATHFSPRSTCTRGQIISFMYRCDGKLPWKK